MRVRAILAKKWLMKATLTRRQRELRSHSGKRRSKLERLIEAMSVNEKRLAARTRAKGTRCEFYKYRFFSNLEESFLRAKIGNGHALGKVLQQVCAESGHQ